MKVEFTLRMSKGPTTCPWQGKDVKKQEKKIVQVNTGEDFSVRSYSKIVLDT